MFCVVLDLVGSDCGSVCSWQVFYGKQGSAQGAGKRPGKEGGGRECIGKTESVDWIRAPDSQTHDASF